MKNEEYAAPLELGWSSPIGWPATVRGVLRSDPIRRSEAPATRGQTVPPPRLGVRGEGGRLADAGVRETGRVAL